MVQIVNMPQAPQTGPQKALGALGQSFVNITGVGLQQKLNEMQTQRAQQAERQNQAVANESILKAFGLGDLLKEGPIYGDPKTVLQEAMNHQKMVYEHGSANRKSDYMNNMYNPQQQPQQPSQQLTIPKKTRYQDRPAIDENEPEPQQQAPSVQSIGQQYEQNRQNLFRQISEIQNDPELGKQDKKSLVAQVQKQIDNTHKEEKNKIAAIEQAELSEARKTKRFEPIIERYRKNAESADEILPNLEASIIKNKQMKTSPYTWDATIKSLSEKYPWMANFNSSNAQFMEAQAPVFIADFKSKMGGVLTDAKINLIAKKIPGVGKNKDANNLILHMAYFNKKLDKARNDVSNEVIRENGGTTPRNFDQQVDAKMKPYQKQVNQDLSRLLNGKEATSEFSKTEIPSNPNENYHETLPSASDYPGKTATGQGKDAGKVYQSDGTKWTQIK